MPPLFAALMLGVIVAAALAPNSGTVPAQNICPYGQCPPVIPEQQNFVFLLTVVLVLLIAGVLAVLVSISRKLSRRPPVRPSYPPPPPSISLPPAAYEEPETGPPPE